MVPAAAEGRAEVTGGRGNGAEKRGILSGTLLKPGATGYNFGKGRLYNLNADACILDHSDICKPEVAHAVLRAVAGT
jgi:hypothetical protein